VPELTAQTPFGGLLPVAAADAVLSEMPASRITAVAPFSGRQPATAAALRRLGLDWPAPGRTVGTGEAACLWAGRGIAFLIRAEPAGLDGIAALADQSDAWARMRLAGRTAEAVLARLVPLDLRMAAFPAGSVARTGLNRMTAIVCREDAGTFEIMVPRSMAATAVEDLHRAMSALAARQAI